LEVGICLAFEVWRLGFWFHQKDGERTAASPASWLFFVFHWQPALPLLDAEYSARMPASLAGMPQRITA
jgi:hypothetical protein